MGGAGKLGKLGELRELRVLGKTHITYTTYITYSFSPLPQNFSAKFYRRCCAYRKNRYICGMNYV